MTNSAFVITITKSVKAIALKTYYFIRMDLIPKYDVRLHFMCKGKRNMEMQVNSIGMIALTTACVKMRVA